MPRTSLTPVPKQSRRRLSTLTRFSWTACAVTMRRSRGKPTSYTTGLRNANSSRRCPAASGLSIFATTSTSTRVVACLLEPIQGEGGIRPMPIDTLRWIAEHHTALGLPLIVDEVQTGCGRTGRFLALAETPLAVEEPEYVVLGKALGGGLV